MIAIAHKIFIHEPGVFHVKACAIYKCFKEQLFINIFVFFLLAVLYADYSLGFLHD